MDSFPSLATPMVSSHHSTSTSPPASFYPQPTHQYLPVYLCNHLLTIPAHQSSHSRATAPQSQLALFDILDHPLSTWLLDFSDCFLASNRDTLRKILPFYRHIFSLTSNTHLCKDSFSIKTFHANSYPFVQRIILMLGGLRCFIIYLIAFTSNIRSKETLGTLVAQLNEGLFWFDFLMCSLSFLYLLRHRI